MINERKLNGVTPVISVVRGWSPRYSAICDKIRKMTEGAAFARTDDAASVGRCRVRPADAGDKNAVAAPAEHAGDKEMEQYTDGLLKHHAVGQS